MKKLRVVLAVLVLALFVVGEAAALVENFPSPGRNSSRLGRSTNIWSSLYVDGIYLYGATAYKFTITGTPTADRTITIPNVSGSILVANATTKAWTSTHADWTMTTNEAAATYITTTGTADSGFSVVLPAAAAGRIWVLNNTCGQTVTFKVTGQSGDTVANNKYAIFIGTATDVLKLYGN